MSMASGAGSPLMNNYGTPQLALVSGEGAVLRRGRQAVRRLARRHRRQRARPRPPGRGRRRHPADPAARATSPTSTSPEPAVALAELLLALAGRPGRVIFCNSGAEANEAAFKLSRLTGRTHMVATDGAFHGRTMGALALTGQPAKPDPFRPLPGVDPRPFGDVAALEAAVDTDTAMVILEPIQGENGVVPRRPATCRGRARDLPRPPARCWCSTRCRPASAAPGTGSTTRARASSPTSSPWPRASAAACRWAPASPFGPAADLFTPGSHGTTFGGNPVSCAAGLAVVRTIAGERPARPRQTVGEQHRGAASRSSTRCRRGARRRPAARRRAPRARRGRGRASRADAGFLVNAGPAGRHPARPAADPQRRAGRRLPRGPWTRSTPPEGLRLMPATCCATTT